MIESTSPVTASTTPATTSSTGGVPPAGFTPVANPASGTTAPASTMEYASFGQRFAAIFLDGLILMIPIAIVNGVSRSGIGGLLTIAYFIYMPTTDRQGSLGKSIMKIKIVDYNGNKIGLDRSVGRYFAQILSGFFLLLGYFWMLFDDKHQTWHDKLAKTYVVKA